MKTSRLAAAFTLFEILIVIVAIGILGTFIVGGFTNVVPAGREAAAVNKARIVNAARLTYGLTVSDSSAQWAAAATDTDRASLLVNSGALGGVASDWLTAPGGYTLGFRGSLRAKTVLRDKGGSALDYPD